MAVRLQFTSIQLMFLLLCSALLATTLQGVQGEVDVEGPSESECRPYIEKALKKLETGDAQSAEEQDDIAHIVTTDDSETQGDSLEITDAETSKSAEEGTQEDDAKSVEEEIGQSKEQDASAETGEIQEVSAEEKDVTEGSEDDGATEEQADESAEKVQDEASAEKDTHENQSEEKQDDTAEQASVEEATAEQASVEDTTAEPASKEEVDEGSVEQDGSVEEGAEQVQSVEEEGSVEQEGSQEQVDEPKDEESAEQTAEESAEQAEGSEQKEESAEQREESVEQKDESVEQKEESAEQATESAEQTNESTEQAAESVEQTTESAEQAAESVEQTAESTEQAAESVEQAAESAEQAAESAEQPAESAEQAAESTEQNEGSVEQKEESTEQKEESGEQKDESAEQKEESVEQKEESGEQKDESAEKVEGEASQEQDGSAEKQDAGSVEKEASAEATEEKESGEKQESGEQTADVESTEKTESGEEKVTDEASTETEAEKESAEEEQADEAASTEQATESEPTPEEDLTWEIEIPTDLRPRDHVNEILHLNDETSETDNLLLKAADNTLKELKRIYENAIQPLETLYKYRDLSNRHFGDPEIFSKPLVLFMGPWSGGKSSIINYLLDNEYTQNSLRTGAEPSPAYFNLLMWGEEPEVLDGTQLAADWTFSGLQKFGQGLEERLRGLKLPNKLLEKINIAEIPGILEVRKQVSRVFPFNDACQWFIDRADIIFLVYDPSKLDVGPETEAILDQLKGREYQTRIILNKADQVKPEELMRVQGALIWNISPLMSSAQPPVMYSTSLWSKPYEIGAPIRLLHAQERAFLRDLKSAIDKRIENKIASARRFAVRVRNHAKMVDCYLTTYYNHKSVFGNKKLVADQIIEHPQDYHIYEGLSTLTNISRYDLPDPDVYRDFFRLNPLYDFQQLSATCTYFRGCPINRLDIAIAYDLPELVGKYKKNVETIQAGSNTDSSTKS